MVDIDTARPIRVRTLGHIDLTAHSMLWCMKQAGGQIERQKPRRKIPLLLSNIQHLPDLTPIFSKFLSILFRKFPFALSHAMTFVFRAESGPLQQLQIGPADVVATISMAQSGWGWVSGLGRLCTILNSIRGSSGEKVIKKLTKMYTLDQLSAIYLRAAVPP